MLEHIHSRTLNDFKDAFPKEFRGEQLFQNAVDDYTKKFLTKFDEECRGIYNFIFHIGVNFY